MKRALAVLLLVALLPPAQAADGVELQADAAGHDLAVSAQGGQPVQATVTYALELAEATPLRLLSAVRDGSGNAVAHAATWRLDGNLVASTNRTAAVTTAVVPAGSHPLVLVWSLGGQASGTLQLQALARRDASGGAGSAAGFSGALAQTTLRVTRSGDAGPIVPPPATVGGATPLVLAFTFDRRDTGITAAWGTSVPATATILLHGPAGSAQRTLVTGVRFTADLGALPDGVYAYNITASDEAGRLGYLAGQLRLEGLGAGAPLSAPLVQALATALDAPLAAGSVFLIDQDRDGHPDRVQDAASLLQQERALPQQGRFLVRSLESPALFLLEANTGAVRPVQALSGVLGADEASGGSRQVAVTVAQKSGWVLVTVRDPHPGERLLGVQRGDGTPLPSEAVWRGNGVIQFADDPEAAYALLYATPPAPGFSFGLGAALLAAGLVAGVGATLLLRRRVQP
jgi:hypothetical protein